jgi:hypothetical protein
MSSGQKSHGANPAGSMAWQLLKTVTRPQHIEEPHACQGLLGTWNNAPKNPVSHFSLKVRDAVQ